MSLEDVISKELPRALREFTGASNSQLKLAAQQALKDFGDEQARLTPVSVPRPTFVPAKITTETTRLEEAPVKIPSPIGGLGGGSSGGETLEVYAAIAGIVHLVQLRGKLLD